MKKDEILMPVVFVLFAVLCVWISKCIFEAIYYSDMPAWLKYILLK